MELRKYSAIIVALALALAEVCSATAAGGRQKWTVDLHSSVQDQIFRRLGKLPSIAMFFSFGAPQIAGVLLLSI